VVLGASVRRQLRRSRHTRCMGTAYPHSSRPNFAATYQGNLAIRCTSGRNRFNFMPATLLPRLQIAVRHSGCVDSGSPLRLSKSFIQPQVENR
jgi:hypothetical protein